MLVLEVRILIFCTVQQDGQARVCIQECPDKSATKECLVKSVKQECQGRVACQDYLTRVPSKSA